MNGQSDGVRAALPFHNVKKQLASARKSIVPTAPSTMAETITNLELAYYPQVYQDMYLGSAEYIQRSKFISNISLCAFSNLKYDFQHENNTSFQHLQFFFSFLAQGNTTRHLAILLINREIEERVLQECTFFFMDGTFRCTPRQRNVLNLQSSQVNDHNGLNTNFITEIRYFLNNNYFFTIKRSSTSSAITMAKRFPSSRSS
jgi:hypothetical protein